MAWQVVGVTRALPTWQVTKVGGAATAQTAYWQVARVGAASTAQQVTWQVIKATATSTVSSLLTVTLGQDKEIEPQEQVTIAATINSAAGIASTSWSQTAGDPVVLQTSSASATFRGLLSTTQKVSTFAFTVVNSEGISRTATINVTVLAVTERAVIGGVEVPLVVQN